ncbi:hypothetical protein EV360DRAFT_82089 [Lentinula raphanica]|nr:hypothetical protein EV360DRAFT_82089 [Lentinula raphanica]
MSSSTQSLPDLYEAGITELQAGLDAGWFTSVDLVTAYLSRIEEVNLQGPELRAVLEVSPIALEVAAKLDEERRVSGRRTMMHGIPVLLKVRLVEVSHLRFSIEGLNRQIAQARAQIKALSEGELIQSSSITSTQNNMDEDIIMGQAGGLMDAVSQGHGLSGGMQDSIRHSTQDQQHQHEAFREEKHKEFIDGLSYRDIQAFAKAWKESQTQLVAAEPGHISPSLITTCAVLLTKGVDICQRIGIDSLEVNWPVNRDTESLDPIHAIALREWFRKYMPEVELEPTEPNPVASAASTTSQPVYQPGFSQPAAIASAGAGMNESYSPQFFDYESGKLTKLTRTVARDARKNMSAHMGTIERGPEVAMEVFKNHVGGIKCITHSETNWRGKTINKRHGHLTCGCPNILALVELFVKKTTSCDPQYSQEADELQREMPKLLAEYKTDLSFSPANLLCIQHSLRLVSGLPVEKLLQPRLNRILDTSAWAVTELHGLVKEEDQVLLERIRGELKSLAEKYGV